MRVMLVGHRFPPDDVAGVERVLETLAEQLTRLGDEVTVVVRRWSPDSRAEPQAQREVLLNGAQVVRLAGGSFQIERFLHQHARLEQLFLAELLAFAPDVVHVCHLLALSPRFIELAQRHGAAVVVSLFDFYFACPRYALITTSGEHCAGPDGGRVCANACFAHEGAPAAMRWGLRTAYFRHVLALAARVVAPSAAVARFFIAHGVDHTRLHTLGVGLPAGRPEPTATGSNPRERGRLNIGFIGSVIPHKGVHVILEALALADFPAVQLDVHGQMPDVAYAERLTREAAEISGLTFALHGAYAPAELPERLRDIDCIVVPSQWQESFAIVAREALALGIPVLVARIGGLAEAVTDGENGFSFAHDRPEELAALLRRLVDEDGLLERLRAGARATRVLTGFQFAHAMQAIYHEAIAAAPSVEPAWGDLEELDFLHTALLDHGFAAPPEPRPTRRARPARQLL